MRILICGASGFVGGEIAKGLRAQGHVVIRALRSPSDQDDIAVDFSRMLSADDWVPLLQGVDAVVNAVGILVEKRGQRYETVHERAPSALFTACERSGVARVLQISALGAQSGSSGYFSSKRAADEWLMSRQLQWQILRPGLIYGEHGSSARFFRVLASLPLQALPAGGEQRLRPVHIDDVVEAAVRLLDPATAAGQCIDLVGSQECNYRQMLAYYRSAMGYAPACTMAIPAGVVGFCARLGDCLPGAMLTTDTWAMLNAGNTADDAATRRLLQRPARAIRSFIPADAAAAVRRETMALWWPALLRMSLAAIWLGTAAVCVLIYPLEESLALLAAVGLHGTVALVAFYLAVLMDLVLGLATLLRPGRRLWLMQALLIGAYSLVITIFLPQFLAHPFAPVLKNLPILAILLMLYMEED